MRIPIVNTAYKQRSRNNRFALQLEVYLHIALTRLTGPQGYETWLPTKRLKTHLRSRKDFILSAYSYTFIALVVGAISINALLIKHFWIILAAQYALMTKRTQWKRKELA